MLVNLKVTGGLKHQKDISFQFEGGAFYFYLMGYLGSQQTNIEYLTPNLGEKYEF